MPDIRMPEPLRQRDLESYFRALRAVQGDNLQGAVDEALAVVHGTKGLSERELKVFFQSFERRAPRLSSIENAGDILRAAKSLGWIDVDVDALPPGEVAVLAGKVSDGISGSLAIRPE